MNFLGIYTSYNLPRVSHEAILLQVFPFSLMGEATSSLGELSITTLTELKTQFLDRPFQPYRMLQLKYEIYNFC